MVPPASTHPWKAGCFFAGITGHPPHEMTGNRTKLGVPAGQLSDSELRQELAHLHRTREDTFFSGSAAALRTHTDRMLELEHEFIARFPDETAPARRRSRRGARAARD